MLRWLVFVQRDLSAANSTASTSVPHTAPASSYEAIVRAGVEGLGLEQQKRELEATLAALRRRKRAGGLCDVATPRDLSGSRLP